MKKKFILIGLAMGSLVFSQNVKIDSLNVDKSIIVKIDTTKTKVNVLSVQCSGTSKSTGNQCRLRTKHESGCCHHHRN
tara:strand:- start:234 stop:467 length:234 start_codon:yes stop_codon:yes gene_type:complete